jgi:predicted HicB family RNase H-like nuclease
VRRAWQGIEVEFSRSARKHRIGRAHAFYVISNNDPMWDAEREQFGWVGADDRGHELEVVGVIKPDCLLIIHVACAIQEAVMEEQEARQQLSKIVGAMKTGKVKTRDIDLDDEVVLDAQGERITEARAEQMAAEAMQEYYRRAGRPSLSGQRERSPQITFRLPKRLAKRVETLAAREGKSVSQLGREALEQYVKKAG